MKIKDYTYELLPYFAIVAMLVAAAVALFLVHNENVRMIEAGYVKQPEMWVKP